MSLGWRTATFPVLDHGLIRVIDCMGNDQSVVQAARVSYGTGTTTPSGDRGLIRYLMRHRHTTPFEMCEIKLHIKLPIFVARQWMRHRTASINEYSARYSVMEESFYIPDTTAIARQSATNKQGRGMAMVLQSSEQCVAAITTISKQAYSTYTSLLDQGVARELARIVLPVNFYTQIYWKIDLHNLLHFIALRSDDHAQLEIRTYADVLGQIVSQWVPLCWEAFCDYRKNGINLSAKEVGFLKQLLAGERPTPEASGLSEGEWGEFRLKFDF